MKLRLAVLALMLIAAACGGDDIDDAAAQTTVAAAETTTTQAAEPAETTATAAPAATGDVVQIAASALGDIVTDGAGNTLYLFVPDAQGASTCYDGCAQAWPPLVTEIVAGDGVDAALLGTTDRDDGTVQATYNGWPLYYFASDTADGDTNGQGVNDVWYVLSPTGDAIGLADVEAAPAGAVVVLGSTSLGDILLDGDGNSLYLFVPDAQGASTCYDGCAGVWPPLVGEAVGGDGVDAALLGSVERDDGTVQATYNGWPLYYFANDAAPGDTNGQGVNDVWYTLTAAGDAVSS
jgi:predicted lipoprotein with Yx(FWY)xxD motif